MQNLPISSQTLFRNSGTEWDKLEIALREEGWLLDLEELLVLIRDGCNLKRRKIQEIEDGFLSTDLGDFPEDWTEEDYRFHEKEYKKGLLING